MSFEGKSATVSITTNEELYMKTLVNSSVSSKNSARTTLRQLGWMALIWIASVSVLGFAAWLMRQLMALGGMVG